MEEEMILATNTCYDEIPNCGTPTPVQCDNCDKSDNTECVDKTGYDEFVKLAAVLQDSVLHSWKLHLKAKKYYVHVILEEYYNDALEIIDGLIEHYQGICKCIIVDSNTYVDIEKNDDPFTYFTNLKNYLIKFSNNSNNFNDNTIEIKSDIDDLLRLIDSTLYKLGNLTESKIKSFNEFIYENV